MFAQQLERERVETSTPGIPAPAVLSEASAKPLPLKRILITSSETQGQTPVMSFDENGSDKGKMTLHTTCLGCAKTPCIPSQRPTEMVCLCAVSPLHTEYLKDRDQALLLPANTYCVTRKLIT